MTCDPACAPDEPTYVEIEFDQGVPCALDGTPMSFLDIIYAMNDIAGTNGYGRIDMVENRLVGVKSRECYEVPGGLALIQAHKALEDLCLERGVLHHKLAIEQTWAEQVYNGLWFSPLKEAFDAFLAHTQQCVSGTVKLKFFKGSCTVVGRKSTYSLYDFGLATYDADDASGYLATRLSGVYSAEEDFSVTAQGGLSVQVSAGQAWVRPARFKGRSIIMEQPTTVVLTEADPVRSRIDRVVLRYDAAAKKTRLQVLEGVPNSAGPAAAVHYVGDRLAVKEAGQHAAHHDRHVHSGHRLQRHRHSLIVVFKLLMSSCPLD